MASNINRRSFNNLLASGLTVAASSGLMLRRASAATDITVLNWKGYGTDEAFALKAFADATGVTVKHDYFNAEAEIGVRRFNFCRVLGFQQGPFGIARLF